MHYEGVGWGVSWRGGVGWVHYEGVGWVCYEGVGWGGVRHGGGACHGGVGSVMEGWGGSYTGVVWGVS